VAALEKAIEHFEQAVHVDPRYAPAHVGIADSYSLLHFYDAGPPMQFYYRAKSAATKALEIDDGLAEAHASLGNILLLYDWDWPAAERELKRAVELAPNSSEAHHAYSTYLSAVGRSTEAIQELELALALDPVSLPLNAGLGVMFYFARQYGNAIQQHLKTIDLDASFAPVHAFLGWAYAHLGLHEHAIAACQRAMSLADAPWMLASLGFIHAMAGHRLAAEEVLDQLKERATRGYVSAYDLALAYAAAGNRAQALADLDAAYRERSGLLIWGLRDDPRLDDIRGEPAFGELVRRVGFAPGAR